MVLCYHSSSVVSCNEIEVFERWSGFDLRIIISSERKYFTPLRITNYKTEKKKINIEMKGWNHNFIITHIPEMVSLMLNKWLNRQPQIILIY